MLRAMVGKHALDVFHAPDKPHVEHEDGNTHNAVDDIPGKRSRFIFAHQHIRRECGQEDEQRYTQNQPHYQGNCHFSLTEERLVVRICSIGLLSAFNVLDGLGRTVAALWIRLGYHFERALGTEGIDHGIRATEIIFPGKRMLAFVYARSRPGRRTIGGIALVLLRLTRHLGGLPGANLVRFRNDARTPIEFAINTQAASRHFFGNVLGLFVFIGESMVGGNLERFVAQHQRIDQRHAPTHQRPRKPGSSFALLG